MAYGKLFTKYVNRFNHRPNGTRVSTLSYRDVRTMAKNLYSTNKAILAKYQNMNSDVLRSNVWTALNNL